MANAARNLRIDSKQIVAALSLLGIDTTKVVAFHADLNQLTIERYTGEIIGLNMVRQIETYEIVRGD